LTAPGPSSWLIDCIRCHLPAGTVPDPVSLREVLEGLLTDTRKARGKRHRLASLISLLVAGLAAACTGPLSVAQAAARWDQETLAAHGFWVSPRTGKRTAPSASMLDRLPKLLGPDERKWLLDELPQLINVVKGEMSLVGPRPALPAEAAQYADQVRRRLVVEPGLTGIWQANGRSDRTWEERQGSLGGRGVYAVPGLASPAWRR